MKFPERISIHNSYIATWLSSSWANSYFVILRLPCPCPCPCPLLSAFLGLKLIFLAKGRTLVSNDHWIVIILSLWRRAIFSHNLSYSIVTVVEFNHQVRDGLVWCCEPSWKRGAFENADTCGAWLPAARVVRCWIKPNSLPMHKCFDSNPFLKIN